MSVLRRTRRRGVPSVARQLAMFAIFLGLLMAPVGLNIAAAYEYDTAQRLAQDFEEGEGEGEFEGEDPNGFQEDPNAGQVEEPQPATLTLVSVVCPADGSIDPTTTDANTIMATCQPGQATFDVSDSMGGYQAGHSNSPMQLPAGDAWVTEQGFAGPNDPAVSCSSAYYGNLPPLTAHGGSTSVTLDAGDSVTCAWVSMETPPVATYILNVWECPAGYDPKEQGVDATIDCTQQAPNDITFKLADPDPQKPDLEQRTGQPYAGMVQFENVPVGPTYTLDQTLPPSIDSSDYEDPFIWDCEVMDEFGSRQFASARTGATPPIATGNPVRDLSFDPNSTYTCEWFMVPVADDTGDTGEQDGDDTGDTGEQQGDDIGDTGEIADPAGDGDDLPMDGEPIDFAIKKYTCATDYDPFAAGADPDASCEPTSGITFTLDGPDGFSQSLNTGDPSAVTGIQVPSQAWFEGLAPGSYTITETVPDGYFGGIIACDGGATITQYSDSGPTAVIDLASGPTACDWINIPSGDTPADDAGDVPADGDTANLTITKYSCPFNYDPWGAGASLAADCQMGPDGIQFQMTDTIGGFWADSTGFSASSAVVFPNVAPGTYTVTETVPDGYIAGVFDCSGNASYTPSSSAPAMDIDLMGGDVTCDWVNIATTEDTPDLPPVDEQDDFDGLMEDGDPVELLITKYTCPEGFDPFAVDPGMLPADCSVGPDGISFTITGGPDDASATMMTGQPSTETGGVAPGMVWFEGLTAGSYTITETVPDGYSGMVVACQGNSTITQDSSSSPSMAIDLGSGSTACTWVNIPVDDEQQDDMDEQKYRVIVPKYTCPAGYDENDPAADYLADCTPGPDGITFTYDDPTLGVTLTGVTGEDEPYVVIFDNLDVIWNDDGSWVAGYTITETVPEGYRWVGLECMDEPTDDPGLLGVGTCPQLNIPVESGELTINKYTCPDGYDTLSGDPLMDCWATEGQIQFDLTGPNDYHMWQSTNQVIAGGVIFSDIPAGSYDLVETVPDGQIGGVWSCNDDAVYIPYTDGAGMTVEIGTDPVTCDWLNIPSEPVSLTINKYSCPVGYETSNGNPLMDCWATEDTIRFDLTGPNNYHAWQNTNDVIPGGVIFENLGAGVYDATETTPPGVTGMIWNCTEGVDYVPTATGAGALITLTTSSGAVECDWLNIPTDGTITIYKFLCDDGYLPSTQDIDGQMASCATPLSGITFTASPGNAGITDSSGRVTLTVPFGQDITLTETTPPGYGMPLVYCGVMGSDLNLMGESSSVTIPALEPGSSVVCEIVNYVTPPTDLFIFKWTCPEGYNPAASGADPYNDCEQGPNGITFTASGPNDYWSQSRTGDSIPYAVMFGGLGLGSYEVREVVPQGYTWYVWDCTGDANWSASSSGPALTLELTGGVVECDWLNIPTYQNEILLHKWVCPQGVDTSNRNYDWFAANCTTTANNIQFRLDHSAGSQYAYPTNGTIAWKPVPGGPIGIQEYIPDNYANPVVFCSVNGGTVERFDTPGGYLTYNQFGADTNRSNIMECHWYNVHGGPGTITVHKWTCPANYNPYAYGANPYNDCTPGPNGVTFSASGPNGYTNRTTTGATTQYAAVWNNLTPGNYTLTEQIPTNVKSVYVWDCYGQRSGTLRPTPLAAKPTITVKVQAGDNVVCHWLNVAKATGGSLTVIKYDCTTIKFVSEVDCHTYEGGQSFSLTKFNGKTWDVVSTNTTGKNGRYTWFGLQPGKYWLVEQGGTWCHITSDKIDKGGQSVGVTAGTETVVRVYNCTTTPGKPGKPPTKYPNTGMPIATIREDWRLTA